VLISTWTVLLQKQFAAAAVHVTDSSAKVMSVVMSRVPCVMMIGGIVEILHVVGVTRSSAARSVEVAKTTAGRGARV